MSRKKWKEQDSIWLAEEKRKINPLSVIWSRYRAVFSLLPCIEQKLNIMCQCERRHFIPQILYTSAFICWYILSRWESTLQKSVHIKNSPRKPDAIFQVSSQTEKIDEREREKCVFFTPSRFSFANSALKHLTIKLRMGFGLLFSLCSCFRAIVVSKTGKTIKSYVQCDRKRMQQIFKWKFLSFFLR